MGELAPRTKLEFLLDGLDTSPEGVINFVREAYDAPDGTDIDSDKLDAMLLGMPSTMAEKRLLPDYEALKARHPNETPWDGRKESFWTPYGQIVRMFRALDLGPDDVMYDLGSGYSRVPLFGGIVSPATIKGIELVGERVAIAEAARQRLGLGNVTLTHGNVLDVDFSDGDVFYLYSPFSNETKYVVRERLRQIAAERAKNGRGPITIAAKLSDLYENEPWLNRSDKNVRNTPRNIYNITIFESVVRGGTLGD